MPWDAWAIGIDPDVFLPKLEGYMDEGKWV